MNAEPSLGRNSSRRRPGRRGLSQRATLGVLIGVVVLLVSVLAALQFGWFSGQGQPEDLTQAVQPATAAELKFELATPIDRVAGSNEPSLKETLAAVAGTVSAKASILGDPAWVAMLKYRASWRDQRKAAEGAESSLLRNWELRFTKGITREAYAAQLDFFGIELAAIMPKNKLVYVRRFSKATPEVRTGAADKEKRYYLTWKEGNLDGADVELLTRAGIAVRKRVVLMILPPEVEATLAQLEKTRAGNEINNVRKTRFGIRGEGNGFAFYVSEQYLESQAIP